MCVELPNDCPFEVGADKFLTYAPDTFDQLFSHFAVTIRFGIAYVLDLSMKQLAQHSRRIFPLQRRHIADVILNIFAEHDLDLGRSTSNSILAHTMQ